MRYAVRPGDSLSRIAAAHGITLQQILAANPQFQANPNRVRAGDVLEIPETAARPPIASGVTPPTTSTGGTTLGDLSSKYETGGRGPGTVSSGIGDAGGVSYGSYQMTSRNGGTVGRFVSMPDFPWRPVSRPDARHAPVHRPMESHRLGRSCRLPRGAASLHQADA